jgi:NAD(P)-dependent dehydrogenase (short-subunit alcohol dehydrogenase family)
MTALKVCVIGASGKLGKYMVQHSLDRGHEVVAVCRDESVGKLTEFDDRVTIVPGATDDREIIKRAVADCDGVLVVLVPRGVHGYSTGTAQDLPVWSRHVGDSVLESNITRRTDFGLFMTDALQNDALVHEAPAIVSRRSPSALAHAAS